jgi:RNA polymerase sigma-70 factor (ECF subfamily)
LTLLLLDGFSYKEMAATLGITENYVGVKISRIKAYLTSKSREESHHGV